MLSPMFKASLALKHTSKSVTKTDTAATTNVLPAMQPSMSTQGQMPIMPFTNFPQYPQAMFPPMYLQIPQSPFMGYPSNMPYPGNPFFAAGPSMVPMLTKALYSPPSSPPTANCSIAEFCESYNLGEQAKVGLEKLGFHFGDDLSTVMVEEYAEG